MNKNISMVVAALAIVILPTRGELSEQERKQETGQMILWRDKFASLKGSSNTAQLDDLWLGLRNLGHRNSMADHRPEVSSLFKDYQNEVISNPAFDDYFKSTIKSARDQCVKENERRAKSGVGPYWTPYDNVRSRLFETAEYLPSPKTVELLGEYLYDDEPTQPPIRKGDYVDSMGPPPNSHLAVESLKALIAKPPIGADRDFYKPGDVDAWRLWFEQVKAGKRTFRFVGDSTEYSLAGTATSGELGRIEMNRKRDENRESAHRQPPTPTPALPAAAVKSEPASRFPIAEILAGAALAAAAVWYFLKRRNAV